MLFAKHFAITKLSEFFNYLIQCRLSEALDRPDDCDFKMELLVWRPFHSAFGGGELINQFEQTIRGDQVSMCRERFFQIGIDIFIQNVRLRLEHKQIAQISDQVRHESHHVFAGFALLVEELERAGRFAS